MRTVILHLGPGKTGSSALQTAFARNAEHLARHGILYPQDVSLDVARAGKPTTGNAVALASALRPDLEPASRVNDFVAAISAHEAPRVLFSSEYFQLFAPERMQALADGLGRAGWSVHVVGYVRSIGELLLSSYLQDVKVVRLALSFDEWIASRAPTPFAYLDGLAALRGITCTVKSYDAVRDRLADDFFETVLGIERAEKGDDDSVAVNRSLTRAEVDFMRRLNRIVGNDPDASRIALALVDTEPAATPLRSISAEAAEVIRRRFGKRLAFVNSFVPDQPVDLFGRLTIGPGDAEEEPGGVSPDRLAAVALVNQASILGAIGTASARLEALEAASARQGLQVAHILDAIHHRAAAREAELLAEIAALKARIDKDRRRHWRIYSPAYGLRKFLAARRKGGPEGT